MSMTVSNVGKPSKKMLEDIDTVVSYMFIKFGYNTKIIVPYADGVKILAGLEKAEKVEHSYGNGITFLVERLEYEIHALPQREYRESKMKLLLGMDDKPEEVATI